MVPLQRGSGERDGEYEPDARAGLEIECLLLRRLRWLARWSYAQQAQRKDPAPDAGRESGDGVKTFRVHLVNGQSFEVEADLVTQKMDSAQTRGVVYFWNKPHWYSSRHWVCSVDWQTVITVWQVKTRTGAEIAKELGVRL